MASDQLRSPYNTPRLVTDAAITTQHSHQAPSSSRHVSAGAVWSVGGVAAALGRRPNAASGGSRSVLARGTTARMYTAKFLPQATPANEQREYEKKKHEARLALALDIDRSKRLLKNSKCWPLLEFTPCPAKPDFERFSPLVWENSAWRRAGQDRWTASSKEDDKATVVPTLPFRVLDAPGLRDDFYCSTLAYSSVSGVLAVALASEVYLWSDEFGVQHPPFSDQPPSNYVSSLSFSSENGRKSILAVGRRSGLLSLWSTFDSEARFEVSHPDSITCVAFKQSKTRRLSERFKNAEVDTEDLAVGDDLGYIWYYSVEWPDDEQVQLEWEGSMTLLAKISAHSQQVCGISWSPDGTYLATGGNDNACLIFELQNIIPPGEFRVPADFTVQTESDSNSTYSPTDNDQDPDRNYLAASVSQSSGQFAMDTMSKSLMAYAGTVISGRTRTAMIPTNYQKHRLDHGAAVKAIAFAPWQPSLLATGGGSNDRAIHFYHTPSGACLATIKVYAQVTGLVWSRTRREIVATFGFSNPEHPFRIAVFAWPSCEQISAIPWGPYGSSWRGPLETERIIDCGRALCAISYPCRVPIYLYHRLQIQDDSSVRGPRAESNQRRQSAPLERTSTQPRAKEGGLWCSRTMDEGCIIVASSDHTVKFHEVWSNSRRDIASDSGPYGGSEILEGLEGLEKTGEEIIR
ncbi:WD40 repeat-like protein [Aspergillus terreus]|uniref:WD40 repeat-like protein n=1 Tax=Aspergillus terreus TaxID=33178 RepID=A0A5M3Z3K7_ASPTE|nr:hypothetical protein ATETN484_0006045000 [Aspergillus terreus]GFF11960.1 WD40 repeat-like protein [Aspergillus terreus]